MKQIKVLSIWLIGLSGSGKTTIGTALKSRLSRHNENIKLLDADIVRLGINKDLGFSNKDRLENIRRIAEVNKLFLDCGISVINCFICPMKEMLDTIVTILGKKSVLICHVDTPLAICEKRDIKGLYKKARKGEIQNFTGLDSIYEKPDADIILNTLMYDVEKCVEIIEREIKKDF